MTKLYKWLAESEEHRLNFVFYAGMVMGMITVGIVWFVTSTDYYNGL